MHHHHHHHHRRGPFGRRFGFPNREQLVERLVDYRAHLEGELENVKELLERLADAPSAPTTEPPVV